MAYTDRALLDLAVALLVKITGSNTRAVAHLKILAATIATSLTHGLKESLKNPHARSIGLGTSR